MATILHKRSATTTATPAAGSLALGELALNTTDGKLFTKKGDGTVVEIGGGSGSYTLPVATDFSLGGIKKGIGLAIDGNGLLTPDAAFVATLTGTQTLTNKTIAAVSLTSIVDCNSAPIRGAGTQRETLTSSTWTAIEGTCGAVLICNSASPMTITIPSGLSSGYNLTILQAGAGTVTIAPGSGVTLQGKNGLKTSGQWATIGVFSVSVSSATIFVVTGDTIA